MAVVALAVGMAVFEVLWLAFPGLIVGAFWAARGPTGRFPAFAGVVTGVGMVVAAHGFDLQADPLAALTVVFAPLYLGCLALGAIVLAFIAFKVMRLVVSGCMKLVVLAVLVGVIAAAWFYFQHARNFRTGSAIRTPSTAPARR